MDNATNNAAPAPVEPGCLVEVDGEWRIVHSVYDQRRGGAEGQLEVLLVGGTMAWYGPGPNLTQFPECRVLLPPKPRDAADVRAVLEPLLPTHPDNDNVQGYRIGLQTGVFIKWLGDAPLLWPETSGEPECVDELAQKTGALRQYIAEWNKLQEVQ